MSYTIETERFRLSKKLVSCRVASNVLAHLEVMEDGLSPVTRATSVTWPRLGRCSLLPLRTWSIRLHDATCDADTPRPLHWASVAATAPPTNVNLPLLYGRSDPAVSVKTPLSATWPCICMPSLFYEHNVRPSVCLSEMLLGYDHTMYMLCSKKWKSACARENRSVVSWLPKPTWIVLSRDPANSTEKDQWGVQENVEFCTSPQ